MIILLLKGLDKHGRNNPYKSLKSTVTEQLNVSGNGQGVYWTNKKKKEEEERNTRCCYEHEFSGANK